MTEPIAYCVDLEEDALIEASKILGLEPTDLKFLNTPLYTHPQKELTRKDFLEIWDSEVNKFHKFDIEEYDIANFARAIIKASRGEE